MFDSQESNRKKKKKEKKEKKKKKRERTLFQPNAILLWLESLSEFEDKSCDFQLVFVGFNFVLNLIVISSIISLYLCGFICKG